MPWELFNLRAQNADAQSQMAGLRGRAFAGEVAASTAQLRINQLVSDVAYRDSQISELRRQLDRERNDADRYRREAAQAVREKHALRGELESAFTGLRADSCLLNQLRDALGADALIQALGEPVDARIAHLEQALAADPEWIEKRNQIVARILASVPSS